MTKKIANFVVLPGDEWGNNILGRHWVIRAAAEPSAGVLGTVGALTLGVIEPEELSQRHPTLTGWFKEVDLPPGQITDRQWWEIVRPEMEAIWAKWGNPYGKWPFEEEAET